MVCRDSKGWLRWGLLQAGSGFRTEQNNYLVLAFPAALRGGWPGGFDADGTRSFPIPSEAGWAPCSCRSVPSERRCVALDRDTPVPGSCWGSLVPVPEGRVQPSPVSVAGHRATSCRVLPAGAWQGRAVGGGEQHTWCSALLCWAAELFESPLLESEEEHLLLDPGNVLKLYCDTNHSGASVVWYKESRPLVPGGRVHLQQSLLEISEVAYEDSGLYVCRARGTGEILRNFTISVVGEHPGRCRGSMPLHTGASLTTRFPPQTRWRRAMTMKTAMGTAPTESAARSPSTCTEVSAAPGRAVALCRWPRPTARHVCPQRRTGPTRTGWTRSCTPSPRGTPSSFAARPRAAPAPASAGSRTGASSGASTASGASG